jgi:hypothetical protein
MAEVREYAIGEDVIYKGRRYVVSAIVEGPYSLRLLATDEPGTAFVHASPDEVEPMLDDDSELKSQL